MARLVSFGSMGDYPTLEEVVDHLVDATWGAAAPADKYRLQVQQAAQRAVIDVMMVQASNANNPASVRSVLTDRLDKLATRLEGLAGRSAHQTVAAADIRRWEKRPEATVPGKGLTLPAGDPIGGNASKSPGGE